LYAVAQEPSQYTAPRWRRGSRWSRQELPRAAREWLLDEGSLTARLVAASDNRFRVRVLSQRWQRPRSDESRALGLPPTAFALVREVLLECAGEPWVCARSVLPARSLGGELRHLRRFGARSLGALLFARRGIRREPIEVARVAPTHPLLAHAPRPAQDVWARRSVFRLRGRALLVQEVFLPACLPGPL